LKIHCLDFPLASIVSAFILTNKYVGCSVKFEFQINNDSKYDIQN
jgi:hypothetical protein